MCREMEKLIELLETFEKERAEKLKSDVWKNDTISPRVWSVNDVKIYEKLRVISKEMWFIKWLVENDHIDFEWKLNTLRFEGLVNQTLDSSLALYMLLSIQDEPIDFLISILK